jgi:hypothetical protein
MHKNQTMSGAGAVYDSSDLHKKPYVVDKYGIVLTNAERKELKVNPRFIA